MRLQSHVPRPNLLQFPGYGTVHAALAVPVNGHHRIPVAEEVILLYLKLRCFQLLIRAMALWQQTDPLVLRRQAVVSSVAAAGFLGIQTRKPNRIGSRDDAQYRRHE